MAPQPEARHAQGVPTTGMRGGLGRTLLTAFLVLAIVPLSLLSWFVSKQTHENTEQSITVALSAIVTLGEWQVSEWAEEQQANLSSLAERYVVPFEWRAGQQQDSLQDAATLLLRQALAQQPDFRHLIVVDSGQRVMASFSTLQPQEIVHESQGSPASLECSSDTTCVYWLAYPFRVEDAAFTLMAGVDLQSLQQKLRGIPMAGIEGEIYLVGPSQRAFPGGAPVESEGIRAALSGQGGAGLYTSYQGVPVIGVYRWMPDLNLALIAEVPQQEAFARSNSITATTIGVTLAVALITAAMAAVVTRQITRPVVRLTESALRIAEGDLEQRVPVASRDEIGILAHVFNRMAAELQALYNDLEEKVVHRTELLQRANYQIQRHAIQMAASIEVSHAITSMLEPAPLLQEVVKLIQSRFVYSEASVYLVDDTQSWLILRASTREPAAAPPDGRWRIRVGAPSAVGQAAALACPQRAQTSVQRGADAHGLIQHFELALPLKLGERRLGVLDVHTVSFEGFDDDDVAVLQNVANQISVALENARAYEMQKLAAQQLRQTAEFKARFLANMSREFREPLMNVIGFSRLMLKGVEGPLLERQRQDLRIIHDNGQHLLGLVNDLLDITQIEAGLMAIEYRDVDLVETINSVMSTASALVRDKEVVLRQEVQPDLPIVHADAARIRQVILRLLTNAAKFTLRGEIAVHARQVGDEVWVSVSDTGVGIPEDEQQRMFQRFEQGEAGRQQANGTGLGLALSREFLELHGGRIWVESVVNQGSTFTFALPLPQAPGQPPASKKEPGT